MRLVDFLSVLARLGWVFNVTISNFTSSAHSRKNKASMWWNLALMDDWAAATPLSTSMARIPNYSHAFTKGQQHLLEQNPGVLLQVVQAARMTVAECGRQMSWRRWNCSTNPALHPARSIFGGIVKKGYRETSFLHALSSATLAYTVARACSEGLIHTCSCDTQQHNFSPSLRLLNIKKMRRIKENQRIKKEHLKKRRKQIIQKQQKEGRYRMVRRRLEDGRNKKETRERMVGRNGRWVRKEQLKKRRHRASKRHSFKRTTVFKHSNLNLENIDNENIMHSQHNNHFLVDHSDMTSNTGKKWQWGGCNDNMQFGYKFSKRFIDSSEQDRDLRCAVNKHNNEAGRQHVKMNVKAVCKCHGLSGSCSVKTCWVRLVPFWFVGHDIKLRFDGAAKVNHGNDILSSAKVKLQPVHVYQKPPSKRDLVYFEESPLFCEPSSFLNHAGVQGKQCKGYSSGLDACDVMCCGRGFRTEVFNETHQCNCTFNYCCTVICKACTTRKSRSYCL